MSFFVALIWSLQPASNKTDATYRRAVTYRGRLLSEFGYGIPHVGFFRWSAANLRWPSTELKPVVIAQLYAKTNATLPSAICISKHRYGDRFTHDFFRLGCGAPSSPDSSFDVVGGVSK